jgi:hypothetical protein
MEKEFVPYELAVKLKALGFDEPCLAFYNHQGKLIMMSQENEEEISIWKNSYVLLGKQYAAPTFSQAFRWFREKYDLGHMINGIGYESFIMNIAGVQHIFNAFEFETYEEAELECLLKLIEIVKTKSDTL